MPAAAIVGAVVAAGTALAAETTAVAVFATIAAIGSTAAAVGQIAGVKELTIAGTALGAVGAIGGLASAAGLFSSADSIFSGVTNTAGGGASEVVQGAVTAGPAPAGGYTWESAVASDNTLGAIPRPYLSEAAGGTGAAQAGTAPVPEGQIVNMISGAVKDVTPVTADVPKVFDPDMVAPTAAADRVINPEGLVPDPAKNLAVDPVKGLLDQQVPAPADTPAVDLNPQASAGQNVDTYIPRDASGNLIPQGDGGPTGSPAGPDGQNGGLIQQTADTSFEPTPATDASANSVQVKVTGEPASLPGQDNGTGFGNDQLAAYDKANPSNPGANPYGDSGPPTSTAAAPQPAGAQPASPQPNNPMPAGSQQPAGQADPFGGMSPATYMAANKVGASPLEVSPWDKIWNFTKNNDKLLLGGLMAGSSFLSGALSPLNPAQVSALNAQAERNLAAANLDSTQNELLQRRLANMRQGIPQARWQNSGLINMGSAVTGRPA